jgi:predicted nucleic acid-binding Zn ribbon protein
MVPFRQFAAAVIAQAVRPAPLTAEKVAFAWRLAVGPAVAKATSVRFEDDGVLHVTAADQHWQREVRRSAPIIQSRLQAVLGDVVTRIRVTP